MELRIYVEGGGDDRATLQTFRECFSDFIRAHSEAARAKRCRIRVIPSGGRDQAFADFQTALKMHTQAHCILLVDAEDPLPSLQPDEKHFHWRHVRQRDGWERPANVGDERLYFFVQAMEAWIVACPEALAKWYGKSANIKHLPSPDKVESITPNDLVKILQLATKDAKISYRKAHGPQLLAFCSEAQVRRTSSGERFFAELQRLVVKIGK